MTCTGNHFQLFSKGLINIHKLSIDWWDSNLSKHFGANKAILWCMVQNLSQLQNFVQFILLHPAHKQATSKPSLTVARLHLSFYILQLFALWKFARLLISCCCWWIVHSLKTLNTLIKLYFSSMLWHCWLGDRKGIQPVKKLDVGFLVVMMWLELCTTYSSSSPVVATISIILCFNKHWLTQVHLENGR